MQLKLTPIVTGLCLLGLATVPAFAATSDNTDEQQLIEKLSQQTAALQKEVASLQSQVKTLKASQVVEHPAAPTRHTAKATTQSSKAVSGQGAAPTTPVNQEVAVPAAVASAAGTRPIPMHTLGGQAMYVGGVPIVTAPYMGEHTAFDPSDLIVYYTNVGIDLRLLKQRDTIYNIYKQNDLPVPTDPMITVSGGLEAQYTNKRPYVGNKTSDVDLTRGELDVAANINPWTTGFMTFAYDNAPLAGSERVSNSRIFLDKGFITIGNLSKSPIYGTIGQFYVPFGQYSSYMISDPVTKTLARIRARALQLGYDNTWGVNELNVSAFTFRGDSKTNANESKLNQLGGDLDYTITEPKWNALIGGSLISNISDAFGMQETGGDEGASFGGFSDSSEVLVHRVPAYDMHTIVSVGPYSFLGEYVRTFTSFSPQNVTYNGHGAQPSALHLEAVYSFPVYGKPSSFALGYDRTSDALAFLLPKQRYIGTFNISLWKDTVESLEFRHDINYPGSAVATGQGLPVTNSGAGHSSDTLTFQLGVYF